MKQITIGVLLDADFDYGVGVLEGVRDYARARPDWRVLPVPSAQEGLLARLARAAEVQGVIGAFVSDRWLGNRFPPSLPVVNTSNLSHVASVCSAVPDDAATGRLVARHFCDLGYRHAAVIADRATCASHLRREGFTAFMRSCGVTVDTPGFESCRDCSQPPFRIETAWQEWLSSLRQETAVFCTNDRLACRFWALCTAATPPVTSRRGAAGTAGVPPVPRAALDVAGNPACGALRPPHPFVSAIAGVGDSLTARVVSGLDLTSVPLPGRAVGLRASALLARLLVGEQTCVCERVAPPDLVVRGSTARFASSDEVVARAMGVAFQTLAQSPGVDEIARRVGVSRRTLESRFRAAFGRGPAAEFRARRLDLAKRLLAETDLPVAEVAACVGAGSVQAFTTFFRQTCGLPPAAWRQSAVSSKQ